MLCNNILPRINTYVVSKNASDTHVRGGHAVWYKREKEKGKEKDIPFVMLHNIVMYYSILTDARDERWGAGVETQKNVLRVFGDGVEYHLMSPTPRR